MNRAIVSHPNFPPPVTRAAQSFETASECHALHRYKIAFDPPVAPSPSPPVSFLR